jgi:hypothetical protein
MDYHYLAALLCALPSYTEVVIYNQRGDVLKGLARDFPKEGRRFTVEGWEWFIDAEALERVGVTKVEIASLEVEC